MFHGRPFLRKSFKSCTHTRSFVRSKGSTRNNLASNEHSSLSTFEAYASRTNLSRSSTVYRGTRYEYLVIESLSRFFLDLTRTGGRSDLGIDLLGTWSLPCFPHPLRVLVSCKSNAKIAQANWVRELEGTFSGDPRGTGRSGTVGLLAARGEATQGVREAVARSALPLGFVNVSLERVVMQMVWNQRVADMGLERVVPKMWFGDGEEREEGGRIVLMRNEEVLDRVYGREKTDTA
ncbi:MAG: hypothetical protein M1820_008703 [Bogoriella megaspora]|nr:MAG: hypothetical protein M1820_008703 [Bogoriella megaspora]